MAAEEPLLAAEPPARRAEPAARDDAERFALEEEPAVARLALDDFALDDFAADDDPAVRLAPARELLLARLAEPPPEPADPVDFDPPLLGCGICLLLKEMGDADLRCSGHYLSRAVMSDEPAHP